MKVKDCMKREVKWVNSENTICDVAKTMSENHIGSVVVCGNNQEVTGIVTDRDIILRAIACDKDYKNTKVCDIMSTHVVTVNAESELNEVVKQMSQNQVRRVPVIEDNKLVGIITLGDLAWSNEVSNETVAKTFDNICTCEKAKNAE